jgi:hypothetical protein
VNVNSNKNEVTYYKDTMHWMTHEPSERMLEHDGKG